MTDRFELLDHPSEIGFRARGGTLPEAFAAAGMALCEIMTDIDSVRDEKTVDIAVESENLDALLYDFMDRLIFLADARQLVLSDYDLAIAETDDGYRLTGTATGQKVGGDMRRQDVKAPTYSDMRIEETDEGWTLRMTLDI